MEELFRRVGGKGHHSNKASVVDVPLPLLFSTNDALMLVVANVCVASTRKNLCVRAVKGSPLVTNARAAAPGVSFVAILLRFPISLLGGGECVGTASIRLPSVHIRPRRPTVRGVAHPMA